MICQTCKQKTEEGKFCTNCGAELAATETAATADQSEVTVVETTQQQQSQPQEPNEYAEKLKEVSSNFGDFFMTLVKKPSEARHVDRTGLISSIITVGIFSLIISLHIYISASRSGSMDFFGSASFGDDFIMPFLKYLLLFGLIAAITFGAAKLAAQEVDILDIIAKYGAFLMPFMLLYVVGILFSLMNLGQPFSSITTVSLLGPVLMVPVLIVKEKGIKGFDQVYLLTGMIILTYIAYSYLAERAIYVPSFNLPF